MLGVATVARNATSARRVADDQGLPSGVVNLDGKLTVKYCADTGADRSCVPQATLQRLRKAGCGGKTRQLTQRIQCVLAGGKDVAVSEVVLLHLSLQTAAGVVNISTPVECLVLPGDGDFLLGKDMLSALGIDERQLEQLARSDADDGDDTADSTLVGDATDDVAQAVKAMIKAAVQEGFPKSKVQRLRDIVTQFDVWRLTLGNDPPA